MANQPITRSRLGAFGRGEDETGKRRNVREGDISDWSGRLKLLQSWQFFFLQPALRFTENGPP